MQHLIDYFTEHKLSYIAHSHPALFTCEDAAVHGLSFPGADTKNLFLRDDPGKRHFLVSVPHTKAVDLKLLAPVLGVKRLGFASPERMLKYLQVTPGSVTLLSALNDREKAVQVVIDKAIWSSEQIQCHPLTNTATWVIPQTDLQRFLALTEHTPMIVDVPSKSASEGI